MEPNSTTLHTACALHATGVIVVRSAASAGVELQLSAMISTCVYQIELLLVLLLTIYTSLGSFLVFFILLDHLAKPFL